MTSSSTVLPMETLPSGVRYRHWRPDAPPRAVVLLLHGLGEHSGRYQQVASLMCRRGFAVLAPDHIGHGESPGTRVMVRHFDDYLPAVDALRDVISEDYPQLPCFLLGHSMGGLLAGRVLLDRQQQYQGVLLSGPAFAAAEPPPALVQWIAKLLAKVLPSLGVMALDASGVSRDPAVVAAYINDPLVNHGKVTAGLAVAIFATMERVMSEAPLITLPILVCHGGADTMADPQGSEDFFAAITASDKTLKIFPDLFHEIFNEPEGDEIVTAYGDWIEARLP